jgi:hypothetical protein
MACPNKRKKNGQNHSENRTPAENAVGGYLFFDETRYFLLENTANRAR